MSLENQKNVLIKYFLHQGILNEETKRCFSVVPREEFLPESLRNAAYSDRPLPLFRTGQTISAPHMCAMILGYMKLAPSNLKILEVGAGSGYQAALLAEMISPSDNKTKGHVYTIERVPNLVKFARKNLERAGYSDRVTVIEGDGTRGFPEEAPYDRIIVTAAGPIIPPPLLEQLKPEDGILCMPLGSRGLWQEMVNIRKDSHGNVSKEHLANVAFVPLIGEYGNRI
ncbi:MAG: protein-L-isoaspartate(D-aspartate) O-methyltransferase [Promethearchaeota archaeon]